MSDHTIVLVSLVLMVLTLGVGIWTLVVTKKGVVHAETAAKAAQASLDDLHGQHAERLLSPLEEGLLRAMIDVPGQFFTCVDRHFPGDHDLVILNYGSNPWLKVSSALIIHLEALGHIERTGGQTVWLQSNSALGGIGFRLTPMGRSIASKIAASAMDSSLAPSRVPQEEVLHPGVTTPPIA